MACRLLLSRKWGTIPSLFTRIEACWSRHDTGLLLRAEMTLLPALLAVCLLLPVVGRADDTPVLPVVTDALYKGIVGKALDAAPIDPEQRVVLQRTNAVVSNTFTARSLAIWAGLTNPLFLIGGLAWGLFAASKIKATEAAAPSTTIVVEPAVAGEIVQAAGHHRPLAAD